MPSATSTILLHRPSKGFRRCSGVRTTATKTALNLRPDHVRPRNGADNVSTAQPTMEYSMEPFPTRQARMQPGSTELLRTTSSSFSHQISRDRTHTFAEPRAGDAGGNCSILAVRLTQALKHPRRMSNLAQPPHERTAHPCLSEVEPADSHHRRPRQQAAATRFTAEMPRPAENVGAYMAWHVWPERHPVRFREHGSWLADFHATQSFTEAEAAREHQPQIATLPHGRATLTASYYCTSMARSTHLHREIDDADTPLHTMCAERGAARAKEDRPDCGSPTAILLPLLHLTVYHVRWDSQDRFNLLSHRKYFFKSY
jgi:hypothetical protein